MSGKGAQTGVFFLAVISRIDLGRKAQDILRGWNCLFSGRLVASNTVTSTTALGEEVALSI